MKRTFIGGFLSLIGMVGFSSSFNAVSTYMPSSWATPPGRFIMAAKETDAGVFMLVSAIFLVLGIVIMGIEFFRKDKPKV